MFHRCGTECADHPLESANSQSLLPVIDLEHVQVFNCEEENGHEIFKPWDLRLDLTKV